MIHSESLKELSTALSKAQGEFDGVTKDATNPFFKSKYATLDAVIKAVKPIMAKNGLAVIQGNELDQNGVVVTTLLTHSSGEWVESKLYLPVTKQDPQGYGSAITYGRRYALSAILGISSDEDDDGNTQSKPVVKATNATPYQKPYQPQPLSTNGLSCKFCHAPAGKPHASDCQLA